VSKISYCVKCGVELSASEKKCPLCFTPVSQWVDTDEIVQPAYPPEHDKIKYNRRSIAVLGMLILLIPAGICLLCNILSSSFADWSLYVLGGEACFFIYTLLPLMFEKPEAYFCVSADAAVTCGYLALIGVLIKDMSWLLPVGIPITVLSGMLIFALIKIIRLRQPADLYKLAGAAAIVGLFVTVIELIINLYKHKSIFISWSLYVLLPCSIIALMLIFIEKNHALKDKIARRLFI